MIIFGKNEKDNSSNWTEIATHPLAERNHWKTGNSARSFADTREPEASSGAYISLMCNITVFIKIRKTNAYGRKFTQYCHVSGTTRMPPPNSHILGVTGANVVVFTFVSLCLSPVNTCLLLSKPVCRRFTKIITHIGLQLVFLTREPGGASLFLSVHTNPPHVFNG